MWYVVGSYQFLVQKGYDLLSWFENWTEHEQEVTILFFDPNFQNFIYIYSSSQFWCWLTYDQPIKTLERDSLIWLVNLFALVLQSVFSFGSAKPSCICGFLISISQIRQISVLIGEKSAWFD